MKRAMKGLVVGVLSVSVLAPLASPAAADDPPFISWTAMLPSFTTAYTPSSSNECSAGRSSCVDITIREMQRRFAPLASACDHNAVFALSYLRTTQTYKAARDEPGFFADTAFVNHEDAVFAGYYFDAYDAWANGNPTPGAWKVAFDAARSHALSGTGDLFLGMSAHVNRDLAFVLADIGLTFPDGASRKPDHDQVNVFLNRVIDPLLSEEAAHFDAAMDDASAIPLGLGYTSAFQMLAAWREMAWRNAERLVNAPDAASRAAVAASIEQSATLTAQAIKAATAYVWPLQSSASRDAFCASHPY